MHQITFKTQFFDCSKDSPHPINEGILGEQLILWLRDLLLADGWEVSEMYDEDYAWLVDASKDGSSYMLGACNYTDELPCFEWSVLVDKQRSLKDKLFGKNKMTMDDRLTVTVQGYLARIDAKEIEIHVS